MSGLVQQSSDVRVREIDLSQVIASNASSRAAIVFVSAKGRTGRFNVTNTQAFVAEYGTPNAQISFGHYAALDYLQEGTSIECVRVVATDAKLSGLMLNDVSNTTGLTVFGSTGVSDPDAFDFEAAVVGSDTPLVLFTPKRGPGSHGDNLAVKILSENISPPSAPSVVLGGASGGTLAAASYSYAVTAISAIGETLPSTAGTLVVASGTTNRITVTWTAVAGARGYKLYGRIVGGGYGLIATLNANTLSYSDTGTVTPVVATQPPGVAPTATTRFTVQIFDNSLNTVLPQEEFECTLADEVDEIGQQMEIVQRITAFSELLNVHSNVPNLLSAAPTVKAVAKTSLAGGASGSAVTNSQIAQTWSTHFLDAEKVKVQLLINGGYTDTTVQQAMVTVASSRGDAVALLDMPVASQAAVDAIAYRQLTSGIDSNYAAIYSSDNFVSDPYNGKKLYTPPSGWAAAICARTDRLVGASGAPAGLNRGIIPVLGSRYEYDAQERTDLFNANINYTRKVIGSGTAIFEQVTMYSKNSALSWLSVRRMLNVIKTSVKDFLMFSLQEPNDDFTRRQIVTSCTEYLQAWKNARGISDFQVVVDDTNNTKAFYNLGILKVAFFVTPIIPIHEIQLDVIITKRGVEYSEINISNLS
jgi:hypothetical protein